MDARPDDADDDAATAGEQRPTGPPADPQDEPTDHPDAAAPPPSDDEAWASIVARLSDVDGGTDPAVRRMLSDVRRHPSVLDDADHAALEDLRSTGRDWDGTSQYDAAEDVVDDLEHFVPDDPGPITGNDPLLALAWGAAVGVPLFLLVVVTVWRDAPTFLVRAAVVVFVVAVAVLVWRMPHRREPSDDDGAVV